MAKGVKNATSKERKLEDSDKFVYDITNTSIAKDQISFRKTNQKILS